VPVRGPQGRRARPIAAPDATLWRQRIFSLTEPDATLRTIPRFHYRNQLCGAVCESFSPDFGDSPMPKFKRNSGRTFAGLNTATLNSSSR
jgi:hypothetical protein